MNDHSENLANQDDAFIEHHYYKGGLRTDAITLEGSRPAWAPAADWVGFRNEMALAPDDYVVEVIKFWDAAYPITWFGVYRSAPDQVYGDRQNHAGVGVWLRGGYPKEPWWLLDALKTLLETATKNDARELPAQARQFLSEYLGKCVEVYEALPSPLGGLSLAKSQVTSTLTRRLDFSDADIETHFDDLVHRLFFYLPDGEAEKSRALTLLTAKPQSAEIPAVTTKPGNLVSDLLKQLPTALRAQSEAISQLESELKKKGAEVSQLDAEVDRLQRESSEAKRMANDFENRLKTLQESLEENDEHKRFSMLQSGIGDLGNEVAHLQGKLSSLRREIVDDLSREIKNMKNSASHGSQIRKQIGHSPDTLARKPTIHSSSGPDWQLYLMIVVVILAIGLLGGTFWYLLA